MAKEAKQYIGTVEGVTKRSVSMPRFSDWFTLIRRGLASGSSDIYRAVKKLSAMTVSSKDPKVRHESDVGGRGGQIEGAWRLGCEGGAGGAGKGNVISPIRKDVGMSEETIKRGERKCEWWWWWWWCFVVNVINVSEQGCYQAISMVLSEGWLLGRRNRNKLF